MGGLSSKPAGLSSLPSSPFIFGMQPRRHEVFGIERLLFLADPEPISSDVAKFLFALAPIKVVLKGHLTARGTFTLLAVGHPPGIQQVSGEFGPAR